MHHLTELLARTSVEPRPYQQRIVQQAVELFCGGGLRSVLIESPTGAGKTIMALVTARVLQDRLGLRVGWVAMRRNLLVQAKAENDAKQIQLDCRWISMFDRDPPRDIDLLVLDEAHHEGATSMAYLYNLIQPRWTLGLSGTPYRTDRIKLCFDKVIRDAGIGRLIQDGYLSRYHHYTIPEYTPESVAAFYCREPGRWGPALCYFHTLNECFEANRLFQEAGICSDVVTGGSDRETQLAALRAGKLDVLVNCQVLVEGFDFPGLRTVFVRPSCRGPTIQMCGRVLRKHPAIPFKQVVQCQKTRWPFLKTALAAQQYAWTEESWRSLTVNPQIEAINRRTLKILAGLRPELPKFLAKQRAVRRRSRPADPLRPENLSA